MLFVNNQERQMGQILCNHRPEVKPFLPPIPPVYAVSKSLRR